MWDWLGKKKSGKHSESRELRDIIIINKCNGLIISKYKKKISYEMIQLTLFLKVEIPKISTKH